MSRACSSSRLARDERLGARRSFSARRRAFSIAMAAWSANAPSVGSSARSAWPGGGASRGRARRSCARPGGAPRMGTHAIDWIMSWWTLTACARRASSRALVAIDRLAGLVRRVSATRAREARVRLVVPVRCRAPRAPRARPRSFDEDDEAALGAEQRDRVVGDLCEEARQVVLGRELARDLEDAREAVLGAACTVNDGASCRAARCETPAWTVGRTVRGIAELAGDRGEVRLPERAAPRVVPEHLAQVARAASPRSPRASRARPRCRGARSRRCPATSRDARARRAPARPTRAGRPCCARRRAPRRARVVAASSSPATRAIAPLDDVRERLRARRSPLRPASRTDRARAPARAPGPSTPGRARCARSPSSRDSAASCGRPCAVSRLGALLVERAPRASRRPCAPRAPPRGPGAAPAPRSSAARVCAAS